MRRGRLQTTLPGAGQTGCCSYTISFSLNSEEYQLYKLGSEYINRFLGQTTGARRQSAALARTVFQRRLASSAQAIYESLARRQEKQKGLLEELQVLPPSQRARRLALLQGRLVDAEVDEDDLDDSAKDDIFDQFTTAVELDRLADEVATLKDLTEAARRVRDLASDSKLATLRECLKRAQFDELKDGRGKLIVFTEHRATVRYLRDHLGRWGYTTCEINGGMNREKHDVVVEAKYSRRHTTPSKASEGMAADLTKYPQGVHILFLVFDPEHAIKDDQRFKSDFKSRGRCTVSILR